MFSGCARATPAGQHDLDATETHYSKVDQNRQVDAAGDWMLDTSLFSGQRRFS